MVLPGPCIDQTFKNNLLASIQIQKTHYNSVILKDFHWYLNEIRKRKCVGFYCLTNLSIKKYMYIYNVWLNEYLF